MASVREREWRDGRLRLEALVLLLFLPLPLPCRFKTVRNGHYKGLEHARNGGRRRGHTSANVAPPEPLCVLQVCAGHPEVGEQGERCGRGFVM